LIIVVSDTSPILALHHLGLVSILGTLFAKVVVPPAVERELASPRPKVGNVDIADFDFIEVAAPHDADRLKRFLRSLDIGESEALALALEIGAQAILIDEVAGRAAATECGVLPIGTLGILLRAKARGLVREVRPLVDWLTSEIDFFVSDELKRIVLDRAGE